MVLRSVATWGVVASVTALGVTAAVHALTAEEPAASAPAAARAAASGTASHLDELRAAGVRGVLYYVDAGCRLRAVQLPGLGPVAVAERSVQHPRHGPT